MFHGPQIKGKRALRLAVKVTYIIKYDTTSSFKRLKELIRYMKIDQFLNTGGRPSLFADFLSANSLIHIGKMVQKDNFLVKNGLFICEFKIRGLKWRNISTANNEGNLYFWAYSTDHNFNV